MLCTNCHLNEATYHYKTVSNGVLSEEHLCPVCAMKLKNTGAGAFTDLLSGFFMPSDVPKHKVCPVCGISESEVSKTGQVGCPECYKTFADLLNPYIRRIHGSDRHKGSAPEETADTVSGEIEKLRKQLNDAVEAQEYEKAAEIRDKIRELEGGTGK